jgi:hypothetical protein
MPVEVAEVLVVVLVVRLEAEALVEADLVAVLAEEVLVEVALLVAGKFHFNPSFRKKI